MTPDPPSTTPLPDASTSTSGRHRALDAVFATALVAAFVVAAFIHASLTSATYDESPHLASGYFHNRFSDHRLNPEHPPFIKRLAAHAWSTSDRWPAALELHQIPPTGTAGRLNWLEVQRLHGLAAHTTDAQWLLAHSLLYGVQDEVLERHGVAQTYALDPGTPRAPQEALLDVDTLLVRGRLPSLLFGLLVVLVVGGWSWRLHGAAGGLLSLALAAFDPNLIAHGSLITTDVPLTALFALTIFAAWQTATEPRRSRAIGWLTVTVGATALAFATKFSAIVFLPTLAILMLIVLFSPHAERGLWPEARHQPKQSLLLVMTLGLLTGLAILIAIWASYDWHHGSSPNTSPDHGLTLPLEPALRQSAVLAQLAEQAGEVVASERIEALSRTIELDLASQALLVLDDQKVLPQAYLFGLAEARRKGHSRTAFLNGEISTTGFRTYFAHTFLYKTPLITLVFILAGLVIAAGRWRRIDLAFVLVPIGVYSLFALSSNLNIGHRHLLPIYPFLFVAAGALTRLPRLPGRGLLLPALAILGASVVWSGRPETVAPHYLAYFNELAGGPRGGSAHLVDSNLDWGQDLPRLAAWLQENNVQDPIFLCYFGTADPRYHGIRFVNLPGCYAFAPPFAGAASFEPLRRPGILAISATHQRGAYFDPATRHVWQQVLARAEPIDTVGQSIVLYRWEP